MSIGPNWNNNICLELRFSQTCEYVFISIKLMIQQQTLQSLLGLGEADNEFKITFLESGSKVTIITL